MALVCTTRESCEKKKKWVALFRRCWIKEPKIFQTESAASIVARVVNPPEQLEKKTARTAVHTNNTVKKGYQRYHYNNVCTTGNLFLGGGRKIT